MLLVVHPDGTLRCLYDEAINLATFGALSICRASHVDPDSDGRWLADLSPVAGPCLGPFDHRCAALDAERVWLEANRLSRPA